MSVALGEQSVLQVVTDLITDVVGDELIFDDAITMETSFSDDLELESIEFVALSERLQAYYGDSVDFVDWISEMEPAEIIALRVGQLVGHILTCLR